MNLYELTVAMAANNIPNPHNTYKKVYLKEWSKAIAPVLDVMCRNCSHYTLMEASIYGGTLHLEFMSNGAHIFAYIPMSVISADSPVLAAKVYQLDESIKATEKAIAAQNEAIKASTESLNDLLAKKAALETVAA